MNFDIEKRDDGQEPQQTQALAVQTGGQQGPFSIDVQRTAAGKPRDIARCMSEACSLISDPTIAETMWYHKKIGGEFIEGPSARLAEILTYAWRNIAVAGNIIEMTERSVTAEGMAMDLERNCPVRVSVTRSIVDRNGRRYPEHMIQTTALAAQSIAMRNAVFKVIPGSYIKRLLDHARAVVAAGDKRAPALSKMLDWMREVGLGEQEVLDFLQRASVDEIDAADIAKLRGIAQAIRDGETSVDATFREPVREQKAEAAEKVTRPEPVTITASPANTTATISNPMPTISTLPLEVTAAAAAPASVLDIDYAATAKDMLGAKLYARVWPTLKQAATDADGELDGSFVIRVIAAPKTIIEACLSDGDPIAALRQVAGAAGAQKKLV